MPESKKTILLVDDNISNLTIGKNVLRDHYRVLTVASGSKMFSLMEKVVPDLILLDIEMPEMDGYEVIRRLKANPATASIPVIFLTAKTDASSELTGLSLGAVDYISKPFSPPLLVKRIELHLLVESQKRELKDYNDNLMEMVEEKTKTILSMQNAVLQTMSELVECRDDTTGGHIERTRYYLHLLVNAMVTQGVYREQASAWIKDPFFFTSVQLHDVGKIIISDSMLKKPGKLTTEEFESMKYHTTFGAEVIERIKKRMDQEEAFLEYARVFALSHHEKWDGSGYPAGLAGEEIPLQGRLMAIADVYDALISERPYKKPMSHEMATQIIAEGRGTHFDPKLVDLFLSIAHQFAQVARIADKAIQGTAARAEVIELRDLIYPPSLYPSLVASPITVQRPLEPEPPPRIPPPQMP
ncbi:MAG: response regulator [Burkholderiaceae bacterium]|jgi:putative two-component system response regulator|nr:response regulator [Burkholderiaceae bacterium]